MMMVLWCTPPVCHVVARLVLWSRCAAATRPADLVGDLASSVAESSERRAGRRHPVDALARDDHAEQGCDEEQSAAHRQPVSPAPAEGMDDPCEGRAEPAGARAGPQRDAERG